MIRSRFFQLSLFFFLFFLFTCRNGRTAFFCSSVVSAISKRSGEGEVKVQERWKRTEKKENDLERKL